MDVIKQYSAALNLYKAKQFEEALMLARDVQSAAPHWKKSFLLEAYIHREQHEYLKEIRVLGEILSRVDLNSPDEKSLPATAASLLGAVYRELGLTAEAIENFLLSAKLEGVGEKSCVEISNAIFTANSAENFSAKDFRELYDEYKKYSADITPFARKFYSHKKIRVGFLSANFARHVVMNWGRDILSELDRNLFEVCCYSAVNNPDDVTEYFRTKAELWRDIIGLTDFQIAELIRGDEIDILFDLSGHTADNRLRVAAYRPASVQVSGVGYMNSTGLDCFDYFLSDVHCAGNSKAMSDYFTEKIIVLPHSHICYNSSLKAEIVAPPCLKNNFVTFGSFNQFGKVTDSILEAWKKILDLVPTSRLLLKHRIFDTDDGKIFVNERLKFFNIDTARVEMRGYTSNHAVDYGDVDIALDTFPYTGGVTTCDALYMGVPVISLFGDRHGTRFGLSILNNVGLDELAVDNLDDYIHRAIALAGDWELLAMLRQNLRGMMKRSPLMNSTNYAREVGSALIAILNDERKLYALS